MRASFLLIAMIMPADDGPASKSPTITPEDRKVFDAETAGAAKDPARLIKLAMWAESKGMTSERTSLLKEATALNPKNEAAWGLLGQVSHEGAFKSPEEVGKEYRAEAARAAKMDQYTARRDEINQAEESERKLVGGLEQQGQVMQARLVQSQIDHRLAPAHLKLGLWCEANGLAPQAQAHFTSATILDPYLELAWKHMGYLKHNGRWMNRDQIAAEAKEIAAQQQADRHWVLLFHRWKLWLTQDATRPEAEKNFAEVKDPLALPTIIKIFVTNNPHDQIQAVRLLGAIETPASSQELAVLAVQSDFEPVRREAIEALKGRDVRDYAEPLVRMIHRPWTYQVTPVQGPGVGGTLNIDSARFHLIRTYDAPAPFTLSRTFHGYMGIDRNGLPVVISGHDLTRARAKPKQAEGILEAAERRTFDMVASAQFKAESSRQRMIADINEIEQNNAMSIAAATQVVPVLQKAAGAPEDLGDDEDAWNTWYYEKIGYRYNPPPKLNLRQEFPQYAAPRILSCFAAGTSVRTIDGRRGIESLNVGDQVLSQDTKTGGLSFKPILAIHHNPPDQTVEVALENGDTLVASRFHRFWLAGRGWVMARDLKVGEVVRTLGDRSPILSLKAGPVVPVFNLDVAGGRTFFVGDRDALVHDNTMPDNTASPFDAPAEIAGLGRN